MKISDAGIELIKRFEGCKLTAYKCPAGIWTIGYGHTGNVTDGMTITQTYADALLRSDLIKFEQKVAKYKKYDWAQNEFDALVSFAFNVGNIDQLTSNGTRDMKTIAEKMLLYNKANGKVLNGLTERRKAEYDMFVGYTQNKANLGQTGGIVEYSLAIDGNISLTKNFQVKEFRCKDGSDKILIDVDFVKNYLQKIRDRFGQPIVINSAYRTIPYNKKVGGAAKSYHTNGQAFDIVVKGRTPEEVAKYAQEIGISGIIRYNTFVHVDSRPARYFATNSNGKVTRVNKF